MGDDGVMGRVRCGFVLVATVLASSGAAAQDGGEGLWLYREQALTLRTRYAGFLAFVELERGYLRVDAEEYASVFAGSHAAFDAYESYDALTIASRVVSVAALAPFVAAYVVLFTADDEAHDGAFVDPNGRRDRDTALDLFVGAAGLMALALFLDALARAHLQDAVNSNNRQLLRSLEAGARAR